VIQAMRLSRELPDTAPSSRAGHSVDAHAAWLDTAITFAFAPGVQGWQGYLRPRLLQLADDVDLNAPQLQRQRHTGLLEIPTVPLHGPWSRPRFLPRTGGTVHGG